MNKKKQPNQNNADHNLLKIILKFETIEVINEFYSFNFRTIMYFSISIIGFLNLFICLFVFICLLFIFYTFIHNCNFFIY